MASGPARPDVPASDLAGATGPVSASEAKIREEMRKAVKAKSFPEIQAEDAAVAEEEEILAVVAQERSQGRKGTDKELFEAVVREKKDAAGAAAAKQAVIQKAHDDAAKKVAQEEQARQKATEEMAKDAEKKRQEAEKKTKEDADKKAKEAKEAADKKAKEPGKK